MLVTTPEETKGTAIPTALQKIAAQHNVSVIRDNENCAPNSGASAGDDIFLGAFDDTDLEVAAFFHELGHVMISRLLGLTSTMSTISCEGAAWEIGRSLAKKHGYVWEYNSKQLIYARSCLATYVLSKERIDELQQGL